MNITILSVLVIVGVAVCMLAIEIWASRERRKIQRSRDLMHRLSPYINQPKTDWVAEMDYGRRRFKFPMEDLQ